MEIDILYDEGMEDDRPPANWLKGLIEKALLAERAPASSEVSLLITDQRRIHELNREYLDEDRPTDVLSFPMMPEAKDGSAFVSPPDGLTHLGEIIISLPQAISQAETQGHSLDREMAVLIVHGVLHLLGYDHDAPERETLMQAREREILDSLEVK